MHDDRTSAPADAAPWKEPRGPHLPDAFQRIPALAWVFIAVSLARLWMLVDTARLGPAPDPLLVGGAVMNAVSSLAVLLTPAALLICHPDAPRRAPILTIGVVTVAIGELLQALGPGLQPFFDAMAADSELIPVSPAYLAYTAVGSLVALIGLVGVGLGLDRARRLPGLGGKGWTAAVLIFAAFLVVSRLAEAFSVPSPTSSGAYNVYFVVATAIGVATILAWAYLTIVTINGVRAGEEPASGWSLGVLAGVLALLAYVLFTVTSVISAPDLNGMLFLASGLFAVGPASLLLAVAAGLPSLEPRAVDAGDLASVDR